MAKTVKRTIYYPTFNEKKNGFDYTEVTHERPMTEKEQAIRIKYILCCWLTVICIAIYAVGLILSLAVSLTAWDLILIPITIIWALAIARIMDYALRLEDKISGFEDYGFDIELLKWGQQAQEQNLIAEKWRADHEFEELIRKAKLSANCNDIAQAAKYYADHYIKGE